MANGGTPGGVDWQTGMVDTGIEPVDQFANAFNFINRPGFNWVRNVTGFGQAADANAGKRDQDGFLVPAYGATTTTGRVVQQANGTYRIPEKDLQTGKVSWRIPTAQEEAYAGVNSKTGKEETTAKNLQTHLEGRQDKRDGQRHQEVLAQLGLTGKQIQAGITANENSNKLAIETLRAQISENEANNKQRAYEFGETMRYQTTAMNQANLLKAKQIEMDDAYRKDALVQTQKSNRLNAIMGLSAALAQAKF